MLSSRQMPSGSRILIVDDEAGMHELLAAMLRSEDYAVDYALSGPEALARLAADRYDLVVTDIWMPGMDGITLLNRIKESQPQMKVIVMTAESTPQTVIRAICEKAFSYLGKPFTRPSLLDAVNSALSVPVEPDDIEVISAAPGWISLELRCKMATADRLSRFFRELNLEFTSEERDSIATAFRELLMNAIEHGGHSDPRLKVNLSYIRTGRSIIYYIRDPGEGFSFAKLSHAAISNTPEEPLGHAEIRDRLGIRPGGFGILLTKNFADELLYSQKGNEVMLIKYLPQ
jgi:CheY-like chemotaxis protein/anti-sigma regulatory factor (Ser/Thr protein kinase)